MFVCLCSFIVGSDISQRYNNIQTQQRTSSKRCVFILTPVDACASKKLQLGIDWTIHVETEVVESVEHEVRSQPSSFFLASSTCCRLLNSPRSNKMKKISPSLSLIKMEDVCGKDESRLLKAKIDAFYSHYKMSIPATSLNTSPWLEQILVAFLLVLPP
jgi:hypothetical protein